MEFNFVNKLEHLEHRGITIYHQERTKVVKGETIGTGKFFYSIGSGVRVSCLEEFKTLEDAKEKIDYQLEQMRKYPDVYAQIKRKR